MAEEKHDLKKVIQSLSNVIDPEVGINIVDLGLIYDIRISEEFIEVDYTLTSPSCPLAAEIEQNINFYLKRDLNLIPNIRTVWTPPWSPERMSEEARFSLGYPV